MEALRKRDSVAQAVEDLCNKLEKVQTNEERNQTNGGEQPAHEQHQEEQANNTTPELDPNVQAALNTAQEALNTASRAALEGLQVCEWNLNEKRYLMSCKNTL